MNNSWLLELSKNQRRNTKILYLSEYAPNGDSFQKDQHTYHKEIYDLLVEIGLSVHARCSIEDLISCHQEFNYVFSLLNRMNFNNSEILISSLCEYYYLPYLGSTPNIRALAEDKHLSKIFFKQLNIPTANWKLYSVFDHLSPPNFNGPYFVKWRYGASSRGVSCSSISETWEDARIEVKKLHDEDKDAILEEYLPGRSFTVPVIGAEKAIALPVIETFSSNKGGIVTYAQARGHESGMYREVCREQNVQEKIHETAIKLFKAIGNIDYFRMDLKCGEDDNPYVLEFNICCNLKSTSAISIASASMGITQDLLLQHILSYSFSRQYMCP